MEAYNKERFVDVFQPSLVMHPKFGWAYAGEGTNIGVVVEEDPDKEEEKEKGIIEGRDWPVGGVERNIEGRHHKGMDDVSIEGGTEAGNGMEKRQRVKIDGGTEVRNGRQKRQKFDGGEASKKINQGQINDARISKEKLRAAWSKRDDVESEEGRKGKVAAASLPWKRQEEWRQGGDIWKGEPVNMSSRREAKPPARVARENGREKWEDPLPPANW